MRMAVVGAAPAATNAPPPAAGWLLGDLEVDPVRQRVTRDGVEIPLPKLSFDLLLILIAASPRLLSLDELMDQVWPGLVVGPETVGKRVTLLREALGDDARRPRYIASVRGRGYRLVASLARLESSTAPASASIARPRWRLPVIVAVALAMIGGTFSFFELPSPPRPESSIAVLPFANISENRASDHLSDGLSEEILNRLGAYPDLHVIARTSSFAFKDSGYDAPELSNVLGVRYLLQGSVRRDGERLRIAAQLVDDSGRQIWSNAYDRELDAVFDLQQEIAEEVVQQVAPQLMVVSPSERAPPLEAYQHYLAGREIMRERQPQFQEHAAEQFRRAIEIDPQYAEAHAELAISWALAGGWANDLNEQMRKFDRAEQAIDTALALKPQLPRAHVARGLLLQIRDPRYPPAAEAALRRALALDPRMVDASAWLSNVLADQGKRGESLAVMERAAAIDPLASPLIDNLAMAYAEQGQFTRAERMLLRRLELPQPSTILGGTLADLYWHTGRLVEANGMAKQAVLAHAESSGRGSWYGLLSLSYARVGLWGAADYWLERHAREWPDAPFPVGLNRYQLLRLQGRHEEMTRALHAALRLQEGPPAVSSGIAVESGLLLALAGDYRNAIPILEAHLDTEPPIDEPLHETDAHHALVWAYLRTGAAQSAHGVLDEFEQRFRKMESEGRLHLSVDLYLFAQNAAIAGDEMRALERLERAFEAGWRDYYFLTSDPRWQAVAAAPRFKHVINAVTADIDAQRARVLEVDAREDFVALLDRTSRERH